MIKLYLKTIAAVILLLCFLSFGYYLGFTYLITGISAATNQLLSKGTMPYIQSVLAKNPQSEWESALKKIQPTGSDSAKIVSMDSLKLSDKNKAQLMVGKIIFLQSQNSVFLYYVMVDHFAIQRIGKSDYALQLELGDSINNTIKQTMQWMVHITSLQIQKLSVEQQHEVLKNLQSQFGMPLQLVAENSEIIPQEIRQQLKTNSLSVLFTKKNRYIDTLYFRISVPNKILVVGPIKYPQVSQRFSDMQQRYYFPSFAIFTVLIVIFLTWLFSRNVFKIYQLTRNYSKGDFKQHVEMNHFSILHGVYENVVSMGNNLKLLMQSQHNMMRFVAHEVRTPLATMQLALDALNKDENLADSSKKNIASIHEDIQDLNKLISYFLLYSQSASHELTLKKESHCLYAWLRKLIERYQASGIKVILIASGDENAVVNFDPSLLKHAVENLLTNALKFAHQEVVINLSIVDNTVGIAIEDDGPGIPQLERERVFKAFVTLDANQTFGKHIGLGLTIAKDIVDLHHGSLILTKSSLLGGSKFIIQFPRDEKLWGMRGRR